MHDHCLNNKRLYILDKRYSLDTCIARNGRRAKLCEQEESQLIRKNGDERSELATSAIF